MSQKGIRFFGKLGQEDEGRMKHSYAEKQPDVDELISTHSELVRKIAWQIHGRTCISDLVQIGYTGLIVAAQKYTPLEGASFASYASIRIRGAIVDYLRKDSNVPDNYQIKKKYNEVTEKLERRLMRQPDREEIAAEMKMSEDELMNGKLPFRPTPINLSTLSMTSLLSGSPLLKIILKKN